MLPRPTPTSSHRITSIPSKPDPRLYNWHRYAPEPKPQPRPRDNGAYIPELSERLERDPNLTAGAKCCARLICGYAYRRNRQDRMAAVTVTYLQKALGKCRRTVQRYLRQLERAGYISAEVVLGSRSRLCTGLHIHLRAPLFPRHHRAKWPVSAMNSGATKMAQNYRPININGPTLSVKAWDERCRDGLYNALCRLLPPAPDLTPPVAL